MTNVHGWSNGLLTNVPDHQVFKFLDNHAQINQREMTQLPEFCHFILLKYNKTLQKGICEHPKTALLSLFPHLVCI